MLPKPNEQEEGSAPLQVDSGAVLSIILRPEQVLTGSVVVDAVIVKAGRAERWPVEFERSAAGAFRLRALLRELPPLPAGPVRLVVFIGRPATRDCAGDATCLRGLSPHYQVLSRELEIIE